MKIREYSRVTLKVFGLKNWRESCWTGMTMGGASFAGKNQKFSFACIKVSILRRSRDNVEQAIGYLSLEYRRDVWIGNIHLEVINI